jgi:hypothetical protein
VATSSKSRGNLTFVAPMAAHTVAQFPEGDGVERLACTAFERFNEELP